MAEHRRSESGFSLAEVMAALFIIALITSGGAAIMWRMIGSRDNLEALSGRLDKVHQAHALMRDDLAQWVPRDFRAREALDQPSRFVGGDSLEPDHLMSFVRDGWLNPDQQAARSGLIVVRYFVEDEQLIRKVRLAPNGVLGTEEIEQTLLEDVSDFQIEFKDGDYWVSQWLGRAGNDNGMPPAVRFTFETTDGRSYEWLFLTPVGSKS